MSLRCAVYARVSTEEQVKGDSIQHQLDFFNEYAQRNDWVIVQRYVDEGISGTRAESREAFLKMLEDASQDKFELILTKSISRLARNLKLAIDTVYALMERDIRLLTIEDNIDTSKPDAKLLLGIHATLAEQESERISIRVKFGKKQKAKKGYFTGSYPPFGYTRTDRNTIVPGNNEATRTVQRIFQLFSEQTGLRAIARLLNDEGVPTPSSQRGMINQARLWNDRTVRFILTNPVYSGTLVQSKICTKNPISRKRVKTDNAIIAENVIQPVISPSIFKQIQKKMNGLDHSNRSTGHLFSGILWCGDCGSKMYHTGDGYVCSRYSRFGNRYCSSHYISDACLLDILREELKGYVSCRKPDWPYIAEKVKDSLKKSSCTRQGEEKGAERRLAVLSEKMTFLLSCFHEKMINEGEFREQLEKIRQEKEKHEKRKSEWQALESAASPEISQDFLEALGTECLSLKEPSPQWIHSILSKVVVSRDKAICLEYRLEPSFADTANNHVLS